MTERLYYTDAYTTTFKAAVVEHVYIGKRPGVILDKSYFYHLSLTFESLLCRCFNHIIALRLTTRSCLEHIHLS